MGTEPINWVVIQRLSIAVWMFALPLLLVPAAPGQISRDGEVCRAALTSGKNGFTGCRVIHRQPSNDAPDAVVMLLAAKALLLFDVEEGVGAAPDTELVLAFQDKNGDEVVSAVRLSRPALGFSWIQRAWEAPGQLIFALEGAYFGRVGYWRLAWDAASGQVTEPVSWETYRVNRAIRDAGQEFFVAASGRKRVALHVAPAPDGEGVQTMIATGPQAKRVLAEDAARYVPIAASPGHREEIWGVSTPARVRTDSGAVCTVAFPRGDFSDTDFFTRDVKGRRRVASPKPGKQETFAEFRPDFQQYGVPPRRPEGITIQISAAQAQGNAIWYARAFYEGEGYSGIGGFGFFDCETGALEEYRPSAVVPYSTSALYVTPERVWLSLYRQEEYGGSPVGLFRLNRETMRSEMFPVHRIAQVIRADGERAILGHVNGLSVWENASLSSYFVAEKADGTLELLADHSNPSK